MAFNMGAYQQAATTGTDIQEAKSEAQGKVAEKQAKTEEFKYDVTQDFKKKAAAAAKKVGNWKTIGQIAGTVGGMALGFSPLGLGLMAAAGTFGGGAIGKSEAKQEFKGGDYGDRFFTGNQDYAMQQMDQAILVDSIMAGVTGAVAGGMGGGSDLTVAKASTGATVGTLGGNISMGVKNLAGTTGGLGVTGGKTLIDSLGLSGETENWGPA